MFEGCTSLEELNISSFDTSSAYSLNLKLDTCTKLSKIHLGENLSFQSRSNLLLPIPPSDSTSGKWVREDGVYGPYTSSELIYAYTPEMAGTWVWQEKQVKFTVEYQATGNDISGSMISSEFSNEEDNAISKNSFYKFKYKFVNWSGSDGNTYEDGEVITAGTIEAGTTLYITYEKKTPGDSNWGCLSLRHGNEWGFLPGSVGAQYDFPDDGGVYSVVLTKAVLEDLKANGGLIITGYNFIIKKVARSIPENVIWKGSLDIDWNVGGCFQDMAYGAYDWSTVTPGTKLCLTYEKKTPGDSNWGCLSLRHGNEWGFLPGSVGSQYDFPDDGGVYTEVLTQTVLDDLKANSGLIVTGYNFILKKVVLK